MHNIITGKLEINAQIIFGYLFDLQNTLAVE